MDYYPHLGYYIHYVSAAMPFGLQVSFVVVSNFQGISNETLYLIHKVRMFSFCIEFFDVKGGKYFVLFSQVHSFKSHVAFGIDELLFIRNK